MKIEKIGNLSAHPRDRQIERVYSKIGLSPAIDTCGGGNRMPKVLTCASRQRGVKPNTYHKIELGGEIANSITTINTDSMITKEEEKKDVSVDFEGTRVAIRKLTTNECFRLMGVPEQKIELAKNSGISNSQKYKMAGNSIVVDQLYYIMEQMFYPKKQRGEQLSLF